LLGLALLSILVGAYILPYDQTRRVLISWFAAISQCFLYTILLSAGESGSPSLSRVSGFDTLIEPLTKVTTKCMIATALMDRTYLDAIVEGIVPTLWLGVLRAVSWLLICRSVCVRESDNH